MRIIYGLLYVGILNIFTLTSADVTSQFLTYQCRFSKSKTVLIVITNVYFPSFWPLCAQLRRGEGVPLQSIREPRARCNNVLNKIQILIVR